MKCAWASIDENKKTHGGKAGNQTGTELKTGAYYDFGQKYIIRAKDPALAYKIADNTYHIVINKLVGYDQWQRETLYVVAEKAKWNVTGINTLCECDCSELPVVAINCAVKKALIAADTYSGNIVERCKATGLFTIIKITKSTTVKQGDIVVNPGHHVIVAIGTLQAPAASSKPASAPNLWSAGKLYTCRSNMNVRTGAGTNCRKKKVSEVTADARKHCVNKSASAYAVLQAGTRVTCKEVIKKANGYVWLRIPSGYICAYNGEKKYVY